MHNGCWWRNETGKRARLKHAATRILFIFHYGHEPCPFSLQQPAQPPSRPASHGQTSPNPKLGRMSETLPQLLPSTATLTPDGDPEAREHTGAEADNPIGCHAQKPCHPRSYIRSALLVTHFYPWDLSSSTNHHSSVFFQFHPFPQTQGPDRTPRALSHAITNSMGQGAMGGAPSPTSPTNDQPQSSETADLAHSAESSSRPFLVWGVSAPTHATKQKITNQTQTGPPRGKVSLPFRPTAQPKEMLPDGIPIPSFKRMFTGLLQAPRPIGDAPPVLRQLRNIATYTWLNLLLVFIPVSWAAVSNFPLILLAVCR